MAEAIGAIDWLVITLASSEGAGPIADLDLAMLRRAFDAKFWRHLTTIQAVLPHLAPDGSITLVGAISAQAGDARHGGHRRRQRRGRGPGPAAGRRACAGPGQRGLARLRGHALVERPARGLRRAYFDQAAQALPARRIATADDVAAAVVLAATNPNLTGTVIQSDGGCPAGIDPLARRPAGAGWQDG